MYPDLLIAGDLDAAAEVQDRVEHGQGFVSGHVDLVQHAETTLRGSFADRAWAETHLPVFKCVSSQHGGGVGVDMKRHIVHRAAESGGQIFCQYVFSCGFGPCKKQVFPCKKSLGSLLPDFFSVIKIAGQHSVVCLRYKPAAEFSDPFNDPRIDLFFL